MSDNLTNFNKALSALRLYFNIVEQVDFFDALASNKSMADIQTERRASKLTKIEPIEDETISKFFQDPQRAYFAHEIVKGLKDWTTSRTDAAAAEKSVKKNINVICEHSKGVYFGEANFDQALMKGNSHPGFPKGTKELECDLSTYTSFLDITRDTKKQGYKWNVSKRPEDQIFSVNKNPKEPSKTDSALSAIIINSPVALPTNRATGGAALFLGHIPTLEMSRCIPHLEVTLSTNHPRIEENGQLNGISKTRFIMGNSNVAKGSGTELFTNAVDMRLRPNYIATTSTSFAKRAFGEVDISKVGSRASSLGMEGFTSPQTLVNADDNYHNSTFSRTASVIDRFRPYMSIKSFNVELISNVGLIQTKTASMSIILHDRSRLSEIAELVKIDMYGGTEVIVEYGWNHPESHSGNPWGQFLNSLKVMEKYQVITTSYSFDEVGQVNINLKLSLKGQSDSEMTKVGDKEVSLEGKAAIVQIIKAVETFKKLYPDAGEFKHEPKKPRKPRFGARKSKQLWKFHINDFSDAKSYLGLTKKQVKSMRAFIRNRVKETSDAGELAKDFGNLFGKGTKKDPGLLSKFKASIASHVKKKTDSISMYRGLSLCSEGNACGDDNGSNIVSKKEKKEFEKFLKDDPQWDLAKKCNDPFLYKNMPKVKSGAQGFNDVDSILDWTNLGTLFMNFCARPLATSGNFDEVQVIFYTFNAHASYVRDLPVSSFPIKVDQFRTDYDAQTKTGVSMFVADFISFLNLYYIGNAAARAYGLTDLYKFDRKKKEVSRLDTFKENNSLFDETQTKTLAMAYGLWDQYSEYIKEGNKGEGAKALKALPDLIFKQPQLGVQVECLPAKNEDQTILRLHVYDASDSSNDLLDDLMRGTAEDSFETITRGFDISKTTAKGEARKAVYTNMITSLLEKNLITVQGKSTVDPKEIEGEIKSGKNPRFIVNGSPEAVKQECKDRLATVEYGTATTNIISAGVSSNAVPGLFEVNLSRANLGHGQTALGARHTNMPMELAPVTLNVKTMGYPFFFIGQEFFFEFGTGTTLDNIYLVTKVSHSLSEGNFNTSIKLGHRYAYGRSKTISNIISDAMNIFDAAE